MNWGCRVLPSPTATAALAGADDAAPLPEPAGDDEHAAAIAAAPTHGNSQATSPPTLRCAPVTRVGGHVSSNRAMVRSRVRVWLLLLAGAIAATACASPSSSSSARVSAKIVKRTPAVGDKATFVSQQTVVLVAQLELLGKVTTQSRETVDIELTEECLEIQEGTCSRARITFGKASQDKVFEVSSNWTNPTPPEHVTLPIAERSFVLRSQIDVELEDGSAAPKDLAELVRAQYKELVQDTQLGSVLPESVRVGDELVDLAAFLSKVSSADRPDLHTSTQVKVRAIRGEPGHEEITLELTQSSEHSTPSSTIEEELKGTLELRADGGRLVSKDLKGPLQIRQTEGVATQTVSGTRTLKVTTTYGW